MLKPIIIIVIIVLLTPKLSMVVFVGCVCVWNLPGHPLLWKVCFDYRLGCSEKRVLIKVEVECSRGKSQLMCVKATALTSSGICQLLSQVQN